MEREMMAWVCIITGKWPGLRNGRPRRQIRGGEGMPLGYQDKI